MPDITWLVNKALEYRGNEYHHALNAVEQGKLGADKNLTWSQRKKHYKAAAAEAAKAKADALSIVGIWDTYPFYEGLPEALIAANADLSTDASKLRAEQYAKGIDGYNKAASAVTPKLNFGPPKEPLPPVQAAPVPPISAKPVPVPPGTGQPPLGGEVPPAPPPVAGDVPWLGPLILLAGLAAGVVISGRQ